jgi:hypothetical protein
MSPKIATANRLIDGEVVFLAAGGWVERLDQATVARSAGEARALEALLRQAEAVHEIVDGYLVEVEETPAGPRPLRYRELLRGLGPSVRPDLGKQAAR